MEEEGKGRMKNFKAQATGIKNKRGKPKRKLRETSK